MKAIVDQEACIGCGLCPSLCPTVFTMNDEGKAESVGAAVHPDAQDCARDAVSSCPVSAIEIE